MIDRRGLLKGAAAATTTMHVLGGRVARAQVPIKVGVIGSTSGHIAAPGQSARRGSEVAASYLQASGGPAMELIFADAESRPENGRTSAERLIREGCSVLVGSVDSGVTIATAQVAETAKIPLVVNVGSAPQITESGYSQVFRNFPKTDTFVTESVKRIGEITSNAAVQPRTAVLVYINDTFGQAMSKSVNSVWSGSGIPIKIVDQIAYDARSKDLSVEVARAKSYAPDIVLAVGQVSSGIMIVREMVKQNFNPMALVFPGSPASYEKPFTDSLGKYSNDIINCIPWYNAKNPRMMDVLKLSDKMFPGTRFDLFSIYGFEAIEIVADAIKRAGSGDSAAIHRALKSTMIADHIAIGGPIQFDEKGQNNNIAIATLQNRDQKPIVVGPPDFAVASVRFPMTPFDKR